MGMTGDKGEARERVAMLLAGMRPLLAHHGGDALALVGPAPGEDRIAWAKAEGAGIRAAISTGVDRWDDALMAALPELRHIAVFGAGMDGVDLDAAAARGIRVTNAEGLHAGDVADHAIAMTLAAWRQLPEGDAWVRTGRWLKEGRMAPGRSFAAARVGILGLGHIGRAIADRLVPFGCAIRWWGPHAKPGVPWPRTADPLTLAEQSDVLIVAARAHDDTRGLVSREVIAALGPEGLLVNIARGFVVDEDALIAALRAGTLGQAALDVFDPEPADPARWADVPNVLLQPHMAGATHEAVDRLAAHAVASVRAGLAEG